ncbi:MAG TPA: hypothetical protein VNY05_01620 [Candidatus Acidoferrales bacterium]|nr:hypothetical protein [Candidatus Acidoferrales bacterium]
MSSQSQIDANRLNSQKSTGPTSPEGKAASSLNALKSGIHAGSHIIPGEDRTELEDLTAAFLLHHHPADPNQLALVDTLIAAEWTQRRLRRIEAELWAYQIECIDKNLSHADWMDDSIQNNCPVGHSYQNALEAFSRLQRRIEYTNRMYLRTLKALQDLQKAPIEQASACPPGTGLPRTATAADSPGAPAPAPEPASPGEIQPLTQPIGFVPPFTPAPPSRTSGGVGRLAPAAFLTLDRTRFDV